MVNDPSTAFTVTFNDVASYKKYKQEVLDGGGVIKHDYENLLVYHFILVLHRILMPASSTLPLLSPPPLLSQSSRAT